MATASQDFISDIDRQRVARAIANAERLTAGEIVTVITAQSASYDYIPYMWAALLALVVPWPLMSTTWWPASWIYAAQLAVFLAVVLMLYPRSMRFRLVPAATKRAQAHRRAYEQFMAQNLTTTDGHTGVLIFVSVAERYAEIIADQGINSKVPTGTWDKIVESLTRDIGAGQPAQGFIRAIEAVGALLAEHFPPGSVDKNELPNHLIVLADDA